MLEDTKTYVDLSAWDSVVIPHPNKYHVKPKTWSVPGDPRLLYVGRLDPPKGIEPMLEAAARARQQVRFQLDLLGDGSLKESLMGRYSKADWIKFHGAVDQETIAEFMSRATALLVPSIWREAFGIVVAHALFAGLPVLASQVGGIPELISNGKTGRLLPPGDEQEWAKAIVEALTNVEQTRSWSLECVKAARRFDPDLLIDACENLLVNMVANVPDNPAS